MAFGRDVFRIPRIDNWFYVGKRFGIAKGVAGGMFLIMADSDESTVKTAEQALEGIKIVPCVAGKFAASGMKVGGRRYRDAIATTNYAYCRCLAERTESWIPKNV